MFSTHTLKVLRWFVPRAWFTVVVAFNHGSGVIAQARMAGNGDLTQMRRMAAAGFCDVR
jgi:hypothetical protein